MSANSKIEWTDHTFNPWIGCTKVSPACDHCYAQVSTPSRTLGVMWGPGEARRRTGTSTWSAPRRWNAQADAFMAKHGRRQRVFCASLADVFDNEVGDHWRADLFGLIDATPGLDWLLLTKRIGNVKDMLRRILRPDTMPSNVILGATICNQDEADRDIPKLLATPARRRFLSIEPLLGPINLNYTRQRIQAQRSQLARAINGETWIDWVIVGGESGHQARLMHPDWARSLRDQCLAAGVPFLFKQHGEWVWVRDTDATEEQCSRGVWLRRDGTTHDGTEHHAFSNDGTDALLWRVGKKAAGRLLDGVQHDGYPT